MSVLGRVMVIPYFTAYLIHYFYNLKTKCDQKKNHNMILHPKKLIEKKIVLYVHQVKHLIAKTFKE